MIQSLLYSLLQNNGWKEVKLAKIVIKYFTGHEKLSINY